MTPDPDPDKNPEETSDMTTAPSIDPSTLTGVRYAVADGIGTITLARPEASNSFDLPTARSFGAAVDAAIADEAVGVILLVAEGRRFCAGGDVGSMVAADDREAFLLELADTLDGALQRLTSAPKPVVAGVRGAVAGAGVGVMLAADVVVAAEGTKFLTAYAAIGLSPDCGVSWLLPRAIGQQRALELAITGRALTSEEALAWGMVTRVVADADLDTAVQEVAAQVAAQSSYALGHARRLIRSSYDVTRAESGADESRTIAAAVLTPYAQEKLAVFGRKA